MTAIPCQVHIRRVADGAVRIHHDTWQHGTDWTWSNGDLSCDCNREVLFLRAGGEPDPAKHMNRCGNGRFLVEKIVTIPDERVVYTELPAEGIQP